MKYFVLSLSIFAMMMSAACSQGGQSSAGTGEDAAIETTISADAEKPASDGTVISGQDLAVIAEAVAEVDTATKERFGKLHEQWYEAAQKDPEVMLSSSTDSRKILPQYEQMVDMGSVILPLVVEKLTHDEYFFTQTVYEAISGSRIEENQDARTKALMYVRQWVDARGAATQK